MTRSREYIGLYWEVIVVTKIFVIGAITPRHPKSLT